MEDKTYEAWQHEREVTRVEIQAKRWFIAFLITLVMFVISNIGWIVYDKMTEDSAPSDCGFFMLIPDTEEDTAEG